MPTRKHGKKRQTRHRRKRVPNNKQLSTRIKKLEHRSELKYDDSYVNTTWTGNTSVIDPTAIAQGDDVNQRVGEEITAKYLNISIRNTKSASTGIASYRILVFWDLQSNIGTPTILASTNAGTGLLDDVTSADLQICPLNYRTKNRYKVLADKKYVLNPYGGGTSNFAKDLSMNFRLGNAKIKYSSSSAADHTSRALYVYYFSIDSAANTSDRIMTRFWYTDA